MYIISILPRRDGEIMANLVTLVYSDFRKLVRELEVEMRTTKFHTDGILNEESSCIARNFVRSAFPLIETMIYVSKISAAKRLFESGVTIDQSTWDDVTEESKKTGRDGTISFQRKYPRFDNNLDLTFELLEKANGNPGYFSKSDPWWCRLKESNRIRDRLMHPRTDEDMSINLKELYGVFECVNGLELLLVKYAQ